MIVHFFIELIFSLCPLKEGPKLMQSDCPMIEIKTFFDSYSWWYETDWWKFDAIPSKQVLNHETSSKQNTIFLCVNQVYWSTLKSFHPTFQHLFLDQGKTWNTSRILWESPRFVHIQTNIALWVSVFFCAGNPLNSDLGTLHSDVPRDKLYLIKHDWWVIFFHCKRIL